MRRGVEDGDSGGECEHGGEGSVCQCASHILVVCLGHGSQHEKEGGQGG